LFSDTTATTTILSAVGLRPHEEFEKCPPVLYRRRAGRQAPREFADQCFNVRALAANCSGQKGVGRPIQLLVEQIGRDLARAEHRPGVRSDRSLLLARVRPMDGRPSGVRAGQQAVSITRIRIMAFEQLGSGR